MDKTIGEMEIIGSIFKDLLKASKEVLIDADDRGDIRDEDGNLFEDWQMLIRAIQKVEHYLERS